MERLKSLVIDENRTVTYKAASKELGVHVNTAKQMLFALASDVPDVDVLYLVAGRNSEGRLTVKVTSDLDGHGLASVASKHVYAVSPKDKANARDVLNADGFGSVNPSRHGAIGNKKAVPRQRTMGQEETKAASSKPIQSEPRATKTESKSAAEKAAVKSTSKPAAKPAPAKSNSLKGMFEKAASSRKTVKKEEIKTEETSPGKENRMNEEKEQKSKAADTSDKGNGKKRAKKDSAASANKRRRIQVMSDSDDSEKEEEDVDVVENGEEGEEAAPPQAKLILSDSEDDDIVPPTPEPSEAKSRLADNGVAAVVSKAKKARVRKRVTKTYVDETGFLCTKQEMESCSASEGEEEKGTQAAPAKSKSEEKKTVTKAKPSVASTNGTKQASIMNFFKKK